MIKSNIKVQYVQCCWDWDVLFLVNPLGLVYCGGWPPITSTLPPPPLLLFFSFERKKKHLFGKLPSPLIYPFFFWVYWSKYLHLV